MKAPKTQPAKPLPRLIRRTEFMRMTTLSRSCLWTMEKRMPKLFAPMGRKGLGGKRGARGTTALYHEYQARVAIQYLTNQIDQESAEALWEYYKTKEVNELYALAGDDTRKEAAQ